MLDTTAPWGTLQRQGQRVRARLSREIQHDPKRVWEMLTDSVYLTNWLAPGQIEQRLGGAVKIDFGMSGTTIDCRVKNFKLHELLEYSWSAGEDPERPIRWKLTPTEDGTLLELELELPDDDRVAISCAGWDAHLEMLMAALEGISIHFPRDRFQEARAVFGEIAKRLPRLAPAPARSAETARGARSVAG